MPAVRPVKHDVVSNQWPASAAIANAGLLPTDVSFPSTGTYVFRLSATDGALTSTADATVTVNGCGGIITGQVSVAAAVPSGLTINGVQFQLDRVNFGQPVTTAPYSLTWNTATAVNGCRVWKAIATDSLRRQEGQRYRLSSATSIKRLGGRY